jgi:hypothetical protein
MVCLKVCKIYAFALIVAYVCSSPLPTPHVPHKQQTTDHLKLERSVIVAINSFLGILSEHG